MSASERAARFEALMNAADPGAFALAATLDDADRRALARLTVASLDGAGRSMTLLLPWIGDGDWLEVIAAAVPIVLAGSSSERARSRATDVLDEAALEVPVLFAPHLPALADADPDPGSRQLRRWQARISSPRVASRHLAFDPGFVPWRWPHPTQVAPPPDAPRTRFGGTSTGRCGLCHQPLHHLVTLAPSTQTGPFEISTCLSCLGWEQPHGDYTLSYQHDDHGAPTALDRIAELVTPKFPTHPFCETTFALVDVGERFHLQVWERGQNLHRVGGWPTWVQDEELRPCPSCQGEMAFLLQLDSNLPQQDGGVFYWGSGGILYVLCCERCRITTLFWQCT